MQYRVTLDSLRQISRSFFSGTQERKIQRNITVRESKCTKHFFYMLASKSYIIATLFEIKNIDVLFQLNQCYCFKVHIMK